MYPGVPITNPIIFFPIYHSEKLTSCKLHVKHDWNFLNREGVYSKSVCCLVAKLCPTLYGPLNHRLPGSSVRGVSQAKTPEWVTISFSRGLPDPEIQPRPLALQAGSLQTSPRKSFVWFFFFLQNLMSPSLKKQVFLGICLGYMISWGSFCLFVSEIYH